MGKIKYKEWVFEWLQTKKRVKDTTKTAYKSLIQSRLLPALGEFYITEIDAEILQEMIERFIVEGLEVSSIEAIAKLAKLTVSDWYRKNYIKSLPDFSELMLPKKGKKVIKTFNNEEKTKIINAIFLKLTPKTVGIALGLFLGLRIGEVCGLRWKDIDFSNSIINIKSTSHRVYLEENEQKKGKKTAITVGTPKSQSSIRQIPIFDTCKHFLEALYSQKEVRDEYFVITGSLTPTEPRAYQRFYKKFLESIGVQYLNFHSLRHSFATSWITYGLDPKRLSMLLGHQSTKITLDIYTHPTMEDLQKAIKEFNLHFEESLI